VVLEAVGVTASTRDILVGSPEGAMAKVAVIVKVIVLTKPKKTRATIVPPAVAVIEPAPRVTTEGGTTAVIGMNVPPLRTEHAAVIPTGTVVGGSDTTGIKLARSVLVNLIAEGGVKTAADAGEEGSAATKPERSTSPPAVSVTQTAEGPAGGTAAELNVSVRNDAAALFAVSTGVAVVPVGGGGAKILPESVDVAEKKPPRSMKGLRCKVQAITPSHRGPPSV
jgi:hypothetical protein